MPRPMSTRLRIRVTRAGWIFLLLTAGFGLQSVQSGNNLVFLLFTLLTGFAASLAIHTVLIAWRVSASRQLPKATCAGEALHYQIELRNERHWGCVYYLEIADRHSGPGKRTLPQRIIGLVPGQSTTVAASIAAPTRGWLEFEGYEIRVDLPFGLCEARRFMPAPQRLPVYPEDWSFKKRPPVLGLDNIGADPAANASSEGMDFLGLREFHPGDHPRSVHWRALGRMPETMLVRLYETQRDHSVTIFLDSFFAETEEKLCRAAFEDNICLALALIGEYVASRHEVVFAGYSGAPRSFRLAADSPVMEELRLWLATVQPERNGSPRELWHSVRVAPGSRAILLSLPKPMTATPAGCLKLAPEALKPFVQKLATISRQGVPS